MINLVNREIPHRTVLGLLFFIIFINGLGT